MYLPHLHVDAKNVPFQSPLRLSAPGCEAACHGLHVFNVPKITVFPKSSAEECHFGINVTFTVLKKSFVCVLVVTLTASSFGLSCRSLWFVLLLETQKCAELWYSNAKRSGWSLSKNQNTRLLCGVFVFFNSEWFIQHDLTFLFCLTCYDYEAEWSVQNASVHVWRFRTH